MKSKCLFRLIDAISARFGIVAVSRIESYLLGMDFDSTKQLSFYSKLYDLLLKFEEDD